MKCSVCGGINGDHRGNCYASETTKLMDEVDTSGEPTREVCDHGYVAGTWCPECNAVASPRRWKVVNSCPRCANTHRCPMDCEPREVHVDVYGHGFPQILIDAWERHEKEWREQTIRDFKGRFNVSGMFDYADGPRRISMKLWDVRLESLEAPPAKAKKAL